MYEHFRRADTLRPAAPAQRAPVVGQQFDEMTGAFDVVGARRSRTGARRLILSPRVGSSFHPAQHALVCMANRQNQFSVLYHGAAWGCSLFLKTKEKQMKVKKIRVRVSLDI